MQPWMLVEGGPDAAGFTTRFESVGRKLPGRRLTTAELMASTRHRTSIDLERLTGIRAPTRRAGPPPAGTGRSPSTS
jgi:hypothetical protein